MSKITIFLTALDGGGAEKVMLNLAKGFVKSGLKVDLLLVKSTGAYVSQIPPEIELIDLKQDRLLTSIPSLINYLKTEQPQALLTALDTNVIAAWLRRWSSISIRTIVTVHNNLSLESRHGEGIKRKLTAKFAGWFYGWADSIVAVSEGVAADLIEIGLPKQKINVVYNPIVDDELKTKLRQPLEHRWLQDGQLPVILGVGRLTKQKNFITLIQAFAIVRDRIPARLMILGEGEDRADLESAIEQLGLESDVLLLGFVDNPYQYMFQAAVLVMSSVWEGFGNVLVEAMAAGTPVVSTNCPSGPAEILADGEYGKMVSVGDVEEMAKNIEITLRSPPNVEKLKHRAKTFSLDNATKSYLEILEVKLTL